MILRDFLCGKKSAVADLAARIRDESQPELLRRHAAQTLELISGRRLDAVEKLAKAHSLLERQECRGAVSLQRAKNGALRGRLQPQPYRWQEGATIGQHAPCLIGMEACVGAHYLSHKLRVFGQHHRISTSP